MNQSSSDAPPPSGFPFSPQDAVDFMQKIWNPFGVPVPGFGLPGTATGGPGASPGAAGMQFPNAAAMFAAVDPKEVQRKIDELRVIEGWLQMSLNLMQMSIKTMELQKASLDALRGAGQGASGSNAKSKAEQPRRKA